MQTRTPTISSRRSLPFAYCLFAYCMSGASPTVEEPEADGGLPSGPSGMLMGT